MKIVLTVVLTALSFGLYAQDGLSKGDKVPNFTAVTDDGSSWELKNNLGDKYLVVYFYPGAMTGGCTAQACAYRDLNSDLESQNASVIGVSGDKPENLKFFKKAHNLNFTLLSDDSGDIARTFGVPVKDGGAARGEYEGQDFEFERGVTTSRWTFILDKNGKVVYKNEQVNAKADSEEVLSFLKENK
jgi:thioredoxin-dependent peroxiredoxin